MKINSLCVYCGSSPGLLPEYLQTARKFGQLLAANGITLVYGGGNVGLMGAIADGALESGGKVIGVIPAKLIEKEVGHNGLTKLYSVTSMHERKMKMAELSDGFIALPGGIGTLEEIFEVYTWTQLGFHQKPCGFLNIADFYTPLFDFLKHMVEQRFLKQDFFRTLMIETDGDRLLEAMSKYRHTEDDKWIDRKKLT